MSSSSNDITYEYVNDSSAKAECDICNYMCNEWYARVTKEASVSFNLCTECYGEVKKGIDDRANFKPTSRPTFTPDKEGYQYPMWYIKKQLRAWKASEKKRFQQFKSQQEENTMMG